MAFLFDITGIDFTFKPGQNCDFTLIDPPYTDAEGNKRTFSIVSSPNQKNFIQITTRMRDTAFKNSLKEIPLGTKVKVVGPAGSFTLQQDTTKPAVFLSGGIGVTPIMSIVHYAAEQKLPHKIYLFYSNHTQASTTFFQELEMYATQNPNFKFIPTLTETEDPNWHYEHGRITKEMICKYLPDFASAIYYLSGPPGMVGAMRQLLEEAKVSEDSIKTEEFTGYE